MTLNRRTVVQALASTAATTALPAFAQGTAPVRIGYAMARTGPWSVGAQTSQEPNYLLWASRSTPPAGSMCAARSARSS